MFSAGKGKTIRKSEILGKFSDIRFRIGRTYV